MSYEFKTGTILIRESASLPTDLAFTSESCVPGWKIVTDSDVCALDGEIRKAGWAFRRIAADIGESVFGLDEQKMLRRAIGRILESAKLERFNSLEIAEVGWIDSVRFPGIRCATVSAHPRHIQQSPDFFCQRLPGLEVAKNDIADENIWLSGGKTPPAADDRRHP